MSESPNTAPAPEVPNVYEHVQARVAFAEAYGSGERIPFRSKLEARWARLFSRLGTPWLYEPYTFPLPTGRRYTPDFRVETPEGIVWVEVKPLPEALLAVEFRLYAFARLLADTQPGARLVSLAMERPGFSVEPTALLVWQGDGVTPLAPADARRLFSGEAAREIHDEEPGRYADYVEELVAGLMHEDPADVPLGEHLFASAVANGADFDAMRVAYFSHDPHSRFTFAQAWRPTTHESKQD